MSTLLFVFIVMTLFIVVTLLGVAVFRNRRMMVELLEYRTKNVELMQQNLLLKKDIRWISDVAERRRSTIERLRTFDLEVSHVYGTYDEEGNFSYE